MAPDERVRKAEDADLPRVTRFLAGALGSTPEHFSRMLDYPWRPADATYGVLLESGGDVVGFIGMLFADRVLAGRALRTCNITSVAVAESHRKSSLKLFKAALSDKSVVYTCFSASPTVAEIFRFFKFTEHPTVKVVTSPLASPRSFGPSVARRARVTSGARIDEGALSEDERKLAREHHESGAAVVLVSARDERSLVVAVRRARGRLVFADVIHVSNPSLFAETLALGASALAWKLRTPVVAVEERWMSRRPLASFKYDKLRPIHFRGPEVRLDVIDALYSEVVLASR